MCPHPTTGPITFPCSDGCEHDNHTTKVSARASVFLLAAFPPLPLFLTSPTNSRANARSRQPENWLPLPAHLCPAKHTNKQCYFRLPDFLPVAVTRSTCAQHRKIVATILHINCMRVAIDTVRARGVGVDDAWVEALVAAMMEHDALVLAQGF